MAGKLVVVEECTVESDEGSHDGTVNKPSPAAIRMRRLRDRRRRFYTRVISVEVNAMDSIALRQGGFFESGESARTDLPIALRRLLDSIRSK